MKPGKVALEDIKNGVNRMATQMTPFCSKTGISKVVANMVRERGPIGTGRYACTCNNWGPRFLEDSEDLICQGCWNWALDHHYEFSTHGQADWLTCDFVEGNTWGINTARLRELKAEREALKPEDFKGLPFWTDTEYAQLPDVDDWNL